MDSKQIKTDHKFDRFVTLRTNLSIFFVFIGLALYNWWILVPLKPEILRSPNELFSDLEVSGQPYAQAMQRADIAAGIFILIAFLLLFSKKMKASFREWTTM